MIFVFLALYPRISKISVAIRTLILDKTLFFRPDDQIITFHLGNKGVHSQILKISSHAAKRTLPKIIDKDKERRSQPNNNVTLHLTETSSSVATVTQI